MKFPGLRSALPLLLCVSALSVSTYAQTKQKSGAATPAPVSPAQTSAAPATTADATAFTGNEACAKCHAKIFASYSTTAMARASGPATQDFSPGEFQHPDSGIHYRVYLENRDAWLSFDRAANTNANNTDASGAAGTNSNNTNAGSTNITSANVTNGSADNELHGKRKLLYFIGSGHRGKTFLFADDNFMFESPINFYSQKLPSGVWDMAPAYQHAREMPLDLPAASSCLSCHTSNAQVPIAGTENKYDTPLFAHAGITCERCHGAGAAHVAQMQTPSAGAATKNIAIVNPDKLSPARRDAVCMQCHLEGNAAIEQPGKHLYQFQPGGDLSDFVHYFVLTGDGKDSVRAVSQFEALAQSKCKRASGDAMTCTTCHDPHSSPAPAEKVAFYRGKCLACHGDAFAAKHHTEQQDCAHCHMPRVNTADVAHTQASDHRILRLPFMPLQTVGSAYDPANVPPSEPQLVRFPPTAKHDAPSADAPGDASAHVNSAQADPILNNSKHSDPTRSDVPRNSSSPEENARDLALAWGVLAGNSQFAYAQAEKILPEALAKFPEDPTVLAAQAYHEQRNKKLDLAREHYEHALRIDPLAIDAASNFAVLEANAGHFDRAIALWKSAFERAPGRSSLGLNLVRAQCLSGHTDQAQATVQRVLEFNPDLSAGRAMLKQLQSGEAKCVAH